ncbi:MAG: hypothetical protein ABGY72_00335, partial [bacterium]
MRATPLTRIAAVAAVALVLFVLPQPEPLASETPPGAESPRLTELKREVVVDIESRRDFTQQMVDMIYSFNELG